MEEVAGRAASALDNALLLADERATATRLAVLQRATAELSAAMTPAEVGGGDRHPPRSTCSATVRWGSTS